MCQCHQFGIQELKSVYSAFLAAYSVLRTLERHAVLPLYNRAADPGCLLLFVLAVCLLSLPLSRPMDIDGPNTVDMDGSTERVIRDSPTDEKGKRM